MGEDELGMFVIAGDSDVLEVLEVKVVAVGDHLYAESESR